MKDVPLVDLDGSFEDRAPMARRQLQAAILDIEEPHRFNWIKLGVLCFLLLGAWDNLTSPALWQAGGGLVAFKVYMYLLTAYACFRGWRQR